MLEIGSYVDDKYKVLNKIGQGGMSVVYLAMNEKANKQWAVKEVRKDGMKDFEAVRQGLVVETELLKRLNHPNLPSIVDVIDEQDTMLIVMDYVQGNPLSRALEEYGAQPQELVISWAKQLCDVLGYLHTREPSVIYRDMKPANVMLRPDGNLTLIDFGTAREFKDRNLADTVCLGTIGYAAPEQFGGMGQTDARTDIYCLGATLYHLVTGQNPCEPPYEIMPIRQCNPMLSGGLEKIILKCTQRDPNQRYQSCAELMYALEHYGEMDEKYIRRQKRKFAGFLSAAILSAISLAAGISFQVMASRKEADDYNVKLGQARIAATEEEKREGYADAIAIKPGEVTAYMELLEVYKQDAVFSVHEEQEIISGLKVNQQILKNKSDDYAQLSFELGRLYWYYYDYGSSGEQRVSRMKAAIPWFEDASGYGGEAYEYYQMAVVYKEIGVFYRDIPAKAMEGADRGEYAPLLERLTELMELAEDESEIVRLELYELIRYTLMQYATKFKGDEVEKERLVEVFREMERLVEQVDTTTDKTEEMQRNTIDLLEDTQKAIELAYST